MSIQNISPETLLERVDNGQSVLILDVRSEEKMNAFQINHPNITTMALEKKLFLDEAHIKPDALSSLPVNSEILVVCSTGNSAKKVAQKLSSEGYQTSVLEGGVTSWREHINDLKEEK
ncbi:rhodanese-like domain-containing protein [Ectobacillus panaciterrae]|uniref:rhodanese-like domain-containing protein n=1 Tax=Ectobacillus panaciterrae TaxID=363872 RepID=UPI000412BFD1|nr:rhodanese-like domain-containing protein [Ectobacillus panaciterrae]